MIVGVLSLWSCEVGSAVVVVCFVVGSVDGSVVVVVAMPLQKGSLIFCVWLGSASNVLVG